MSSAPARTMPLANAPASCDGDEHRRGEPVGQLGERRGRVGGAQDDVIERQLHAARGYLGYAGKRGLRRFAAGTGNGKPSYDGLRRGPGSGPGSPGCRWWPAGRPRSRPRRTRRPCGRRTRRPTRTRRRSGRRSAVPPGRRGAGIAFEAALQHAGGDLRAVAADELRREVGADVDARARRSRSCPCRARRRPRGRGSSGCRSRRRPAPSVCVMRVAVPSPRSGSIWKRPPLAQSLAWIFMLRPVPVRSSSRPSSLSSSTLIAAGERQPAVVGHLARVGDDPAPAGHVERVGARR